MEAEIGEILNIINFGWFISEEIVYVIYQSRVENIIGDKSLAESRKERERERASRSRLLSIALLTVCRMAKRCEINETSLRPIVNQETTAGVENRI